MANSSAAIFSSHLLSTGGVTIHRGNQQSLLFSNRSCPADRTLQKIGGCFKIQAAKVPAGVEFPNKEPKFQPAFLGFTRVAETWNSRACMIGLVGVFIIELILNRGILQMIGVDVGKGLNLPL